MKNVPSNAPVVVSIPVQWGDQDAMGHVNNVYPIRWFESARIAYLSKLTIGQLDDSSHIAPILAAISCSYRKQLRFPDTVHVTTSAVKLGRTSLTLQHRIVSEASGEVAAEGESVVVLFDYEAQRPVPIPDGIRKRAREIEGP